MSATSMKRRGPNRHVTPPELERSTIRYYKHSILSDCEQTDSTEFPGSCPLAHGRRSKVNSTPGFADGLIFSLLPSSLYSHLVVVPIDSGLDCASCCRLITLPCTSNVPQVAPGP